MEFLGKIKNIFKIGIKKKTINNRTGTIEFQGKPGQPCLVYWPYGMIGNADNNIPIGLLADQGNEESLIGLPFDIANREDLNEKEIGFGVPSLSARIYFRNDGHITFKIGDQEGGDFAVRFNELKAGYDELKQDLNDLISLYNAHIHITTATVGPTPVPGIIAPTVSTGTPSTASIDDSKIPEIELPEL